MKKVQFLKYSIFEIFNFFKISQIPIINIKFKFKINYKTCIQEKHLSLLYASWD